VNSVRNLQPTVKVLYIVGSSRCGSTVLSNILGEIEGCFSGGEIRYLWDRALQGRRCGCGARVDGCELWGALLPSEEQEIRALRATQHAVLRLHHTPALLRRSPKRLLGSTDLSRYVAAMTDVYERLGRLTQARVIVDSSKRPSNGAALRLIPTIEPYFLHLVRDPRGVAYSRLRHKPNPDGAGEMPTVSTGFTIVDWMATNLAAEDVRRHLGRERSMFLRYEDFMMDPKATVERIESFVGERVGRAPFLDDRTVALGPNHTVSGNPDRFERGAVRLLPDVEWRERLSVSNRRMTTALTLPLLARYGYHVNTRHDDRVGAPNAREIGSGRTDG
jgi:Sulfotransferase family